MTASPFIDDLLIRARRGMGYTSVTGAGESARRVGVTGRSDRLWRGLASPGAAFVKRVPGGGVQHVKQLSGQLAYVNGKAKGAFGMATGIAFGGDDIDKDPLDDMMAAWAQDWKGRPRNGHTSHMILSFPEDVSAQAAFAISQDWCAEMFEDQVHTADTWEYVAVLHTDKAHPHVHVILNNRGGAGKWFSISAEGAFSPQLMRDRMSDIADGFGVYLESTTRADRGLYNTPIRNEEFWAKTAGRTEIRAQERQKTSEAWQRADMGETARLYTVLSEFAAVIGAPVIAKRAHLSAAALLAGNEVPKGEDMDIDLDVTADRADIRTTLIAWAQENRQQIEALPRADQSVIAQKIDAALEIIESDGAPDLTEDTVWSGFADTPSSYLIHDADALEARAALYVDEDKVDLLHAFVSENQLESYLVTGDVPDRFEEVLPAIAEAYREMYSHELAEIPTEMRRYVQQAAGLGLDPVTVQDRLIKAVGNPAENARMEREDIARIAMAQSPIVADTVAFEDMLKTIDDGVAASLNEGQKNPYDIFEQVTIGLDRGENGASRGDKNEGWTHMSEGLVALADAKERDALTEEQTNAFDTVVPVLLQRHGAQMKAGTIEFYEDQLPLAAQDEEILRSGKSENEIEDELTTQAEAQNAALRTVIDQHQLGSVDVVTAFRLAETKYRDLQLSLADVEQTIIDNSTVIDRDGFEHAVRDVAQNALSTGSADFETPEVGRTMLRAFVALEGKEVMKEVAEGSLDALSEYLDTPAQQKMVAKELLKSAKSVDVGLSQEEIEDGLEAVDPLYSRGRGYSI